MKAAASPIPHLIRRLVEDPRVRELPDRELLRRFQQVGRVVRFWEGSMMRLSLVVGCVLWAAQAPAQDREGEEAAAIRQRSEQYAAAVCKKDAMALSQLLSDGYSQSAFQLPDDKKGTIDYFTEPRRTFAFFRTAGARVRVDGDTAIETGEIHASGTAYGSDFTWGGLKYSRVWLKRGGVWRVAHEHRG